MTESKINQLFTLWWKLIHASSVIDLVSQVKAGLHALIPFEQASLALAQQCSNLTGGTPLFSAMLNYRHSGPGTASGPSEELGEESSGGGITEIG